MSGHRFPTVVRLAVIAIVLATLPMCGGSTPAPPPPVRVSVDGTAREVAPGTTFAGLIDQLGLEADDGRLLSVSGEVLDPLARRGRIVLNGSPAPPGMRLHQGDAIHVIDQHDRIEGARRVVVDIDQPQVANPERTLTRYPIREITTEGRISGDVVSVREIPRGHGETPRAVALTFDDGPWPVHTERVLSILHRFHVKATFFMVGYEVERYPELVRRVKRAGHEIGNHSFDHPVSPPLADLTEAHITAEMADTNAQLGDDGVRPTLFRPPGGSYDDFVIDEARRQGMRIVMWSVDPQDWRSGRSRKDIVKKVLRQVEAGSIILLHDGGGDAGHTIAALPDLIRGIRKKGLRFVTVPA
jgi:peptidoglycan/xylan/chitin deacetylase (PgdA/CDA1 family)